VRRLFPVLLFPLSVAPLAHAAPTRTSASVAAPIRSPTAATVSWDGVGNATGYNVYWGTKVGSYGTPANAGSLLSFYVTGLTVGQQYFFTVTAYDAAGEGAQTTPVAYSP
jgi:hypothetical protein